MSNEANIAIKLEIAKGNLNYRSYPTGFSSTVVGAKGPTPGAFTATPGGTTVDLSELETPGLAILRNLESSGGNFVSWGIWDGTEFYPLGEILPGEFYVLRLSRYLGRSFDSGIGTGTYDSGTYSLMVKAENANCNCSVEAFEA